MIGDAIIEITEKWFLLKMKFWVKININYWVVYGWSYVNNQKIYINTQKIKSNFFDKIGWEKPDFIVV